MPVSVPAAEEDKEEEDSTSYTATSTLTDVHVTNLGQSFTEESEEIRVYFEGDEEEMEEMEDQELSAVTGTGSDTAASSVGNSLLQLDLGPTSNMTNMDASNMDTHMDSNTSGPMQLSLEYKGSEGSPITATGEMGAERGGEMDIDIDKDAHNMPISIESPTKALGTIRNPGSPAKGTRGSNGHGKGSLSRPLGLGPPSRRTSSTTSTHSSPVSLVSPVETQTQNQMDCR